LGIEWIGFIQDYLTTEEPQYLRNKYQERYTTHTSVEGVGQFHNSALRERSSYLYLYVRLTSI